MIFERLLIYTVNGQVQLFSAIKTNGDATVEVF